MVLQKSPWDSCRQTRGVASQRSKARCLLRAAMLSSPFKKSALAFQVLQPRGTAAALKDILGAPLGLRNASAQSSSSTSLGSRSLKFVDDHALVNSKLRHKWIRPLKATRCIWLRSNSKQGNHIVKCHSLGSHSVDVCCQPRIGLTDHFPYTLCCEFCSSSFAILVCAEMQLHPAAERRDGPDLKPFPWSKPKRI